MLEPTVRPGSTSASGGAQQGKPAFENRTFQDLLSDASIQATQQAGAGGSEPAAGNPLGVLAGLGQIENAALRSVLAQAHKSGSTAGKTI